jgi:hypothetical protein
MFRVYVHEKLRIVDPSVLFVLIEGDQERFMTIYMHLVISTPILSLYIEMFSVRIYEHYQNNTDMHTS